MASAYYRDYSCLWLTGGRRMSHGPGHRMPYGSDRWVTVSICNAVVLSLLSPQWTPQVFYASSCTWLTGQEGGGRMCAFSAQKDHILSGEKGKLFLTRVKQFKCNATARSINTWHFDKNCSFSAHQLVKHFLHMFSVLSLFLCICILSCLQSF